MLLSLCETLLVCKQFTREKKMYKTKMSVNIRHFYHFTVCFTFLLFGSFHLDVTLQIHIKIYKQSKLFIQNGSNNNNDQRVIATSVKKRKYLISIYFDIQFNQPNSSATLSWINSSKGLIFLCVWMWASVCIYNKQEYYWWISCF